jgi:adenylosuccinate lyase
VEEPFEKDQIGSSAMAYKRNPMRFVDNSSHTKGKAVLTDDGAASQMRTRVQLGKTSHGSPSKRVDDIIRPMARAHSRRQVTPFHCGTRSGVATDFLLAFASANRRVTLPEAFLTSDILLTLLQNISEGLVVYPAIIKKRISQELPFMATENIIMALVKAGGDRQEAHERIRVLSHEAAQVVKEQGGDNDLIQRVRRDPFFAPVWDDLDHLLEPKAFVGRAPEQTVAFVENWVKPALEPHQAVIAQAKNADLNV